MAIWPVSATDTILHVLTRLQIDGFKNLRGVDLRFGPLTCIAGRNGVGKSNLFDAIELLSNLASMPVLKAATRVRGTGGRLSGIEELFGQYGDAAPAIRLSAEMIVPRQVNDDFDRPAEATATCLRYTVELTLRQGDTGQQGPALQLQHEELVALSLEAATRELKFAPDKAWRARYLKGPRSRTTPFIDTLPNGAILLFGDMGRGGRPLAVPAAKSPLTVLAGVTASTHPTALAARREMQSWRMLQLEPSALRAPDEFGDDSSVSATGGHMPNSLRRIGCQAELANLLSDLIPGVVTIDVDSDEARQQRVLRVTLRDRRAYQASSLSDGTLRFIALGLLGLDPLVTGLVCLEEPENGIHPQRIPEMMRLVQSLAEDLPADPADDLSAQSASPRQVIINTHSPLVVKNLADDTLLMADSLRQSSQEWITFKALAGTWRAEGLRPTQLVSHGVLTAYLGGAPTEAKVRTGRRTVQDHLTGERFPS
jgi:predicted ATPase